MRLLSTIGNALSAKIENNGLRVVGEVVGVPKSTLHTWGGDPHHWTLAAGLALAAADAEIRAAILEYIDGTQQRAHPADATRDAFGVLIAGNKALATLATDLADGTLSPADARATLPELRALQTTLRRLIMDAEAVASAAGVIGAVGGRP